MNFQFWNIRSYTIAFDGHSFILRIEKRQNNTKTIQIKAIVAHQGNSI